jgi:hypothetical protein
VKALEGQDRREAGGDAKQVIAAAAAFQNALEEIAKAAAVPVLTRRAGDAQEPRR